MPRPISPVSITDDQGYLQVCHVLCQNSVHSCWTGVSRSLGRSAVFADQAAEDLPTPFRAEISSIALTSADDNRRLQLQ